MRRGDVMARLTRALELWHEGDSAAAVHVIEDLRRELGYRDFRRPHRCPNCGVAFRWPGELDHHLRFGSCWQRPGKAAA